MKFYLIQISTQNFNKLIIFIVSIFVLNENMIKAVKNIFVKLLTINYQTLTLLYHLKETFNSSSK